MSPKSISIAIALLIGCGMSASTLNFYSRRYIGELSILKNCTPPAVCLSVLDFWGHRVVSHFSVDQSSLIEPCLVFFDNIHSWPYVWRMCLHLQRNHFQSSNNSLWTDSYSYKVSLKVRLHGPLSWPPILMKLCTSLGSLHEYLTSTNQYPALSAISFKIVLKVGVVTLIPGPMLRTVDEQDNVVAISDVVPPLRSQSREALAVMAKQPLLPLQVSGDRQYYISLRHGILADKETLFNLMKGTYDPSRQPETTEKA